MSTNPTEADVQRLLAVLNDDDSSFEEKTAAFKQLFDWGYGPGTPPIDSSNRTDGAYRKG